MPAWAELDLAPPQIGKVYDPSASAMAHLRRLHAKICRLVVTRPEIITHNEAIRALEEELLEALINCLVGGEARAELHDSEVMHRVDDLLIGQPHVEFSVSELCAATGVSEKTLQTHCKTFAGIKPDDCIRLRRMNLARTALRGIRSAEDFESIVSRYGFRDVARFIRQYNDTLGEDPTKDVETDGPHRAGTI